MNKTRDALTELVQRFRSYTPAQQQQILDRIRAEIVAEQSIRAAVQPKNE